MSHIFKHAYITICTSAGNDKNSGCFPGVAHLRGESLTLDMLSPGQGVWRVTLSENSSRLFGTLFGPLSKRRWCLQERILSTRLLHCGYERLVFKCNEHAKLEDGLVHRQLVGRSSYPGDNRPEIEFGRTLPLLRHFTTPSNEALQIPSKSPTFLDHNFHYCWIKTVINYSHRLFIYPTDRLPAISGLVTFLAASCDFQFLPIQSP